MPSILKSFVPQDEHVPVSALRPFFSRTSFGDDISLFAFSLTQYASVMTSRYIEKCINGREANEVHRMLT